MNGNYPAIWLSGKSQHIHRLQWKKWFGDIPKGSVVHHKDGDKLNWEIGNLQLLSREEHIREHKNAVHRKGVKVIAIKNSKCMYFDSIQEAANQCGTYPMCIHRVFVGKQKTANGWRFMRG